jgi:predicted metal-dependent phosphoesterase TrpH
MDADKIILRIELHCHTRYSKDSLINLKYLLHTCTRRKIDRIVITDHNTILGAQLAHELDPERVIIGEEIMTTRGEILAAFVKEEIPAGLHPIEVITCLREQGAFISVSHPFDKMRSGHWEYADLLEITPLVDAIETFNARCILPIYNSQAQEFANLHNLLCTAGSDAHSLMEVGQATLYLPVFDDAPSLKLALIQAQPRGILSAPWVHLSSRYAVWRKSLEEPPISP